jgi:hypothetical protein
LNCCTYWPQTPNGHSPTPKSTSRTNKSRNQSPKPVEEKKRPRLKLGSVCKTPIRLTSQTVVKSTGLTPRARDGSGESRFGSTSKTRGSQMVESGSQAGVVVPELHIENSPGHSASSSFISAPPELPSSTKGESQHDLLIAEEFEGSDDEKHGKQHDPDQEVRSGETGRDASNGTGNEDPAASSKSETDGEMGGGKTSQELAEVRAEFAKQKVCCARFPSMHLQTLV